MEEQRNFCKGFQYNLSQGQLHRLERKQFKKSRNALQKGVKKNLRNQLDVKQEWWRKKTKRVIRRTKTSKYSETVFFGSDSVKCVVCQDDFKILTSELPPCLNFRSQQFMFDKDRKRVKAGRRRRRKAILGSVNGLVSK